MNTAISGDYYDYTKTMQPERPWLLPYHQTLVYKMRTTMIRTLLSSIVFSLLTLPLQAAEDSKPTLKAQMALPFRDHAVLQQNAKLPVWGTSLPGAKVTVAFDEQTKTT